MTTISPDQVQIKCAWCKRKFKSVRAVREHSTKQHHDNYKIKYTLKEHNEVLS